MCIRDRVYSISSAFKPLDEIYLYPPRFFVKNPTFNNFQDLLVVMSSSYVPFTRYVFNTVLITLLGTVGHLIIGSMAAYVLAKYEFPGSKKIFKIIQAAIMFNAYVLQIPTYIIMSKLGWIDTYLALMVLSLIHISHRKEFLLWITYQHPVSFLNIPDDL